MFFFTRSTTLAESGFFASHIDYHSHILPGVDDGSPDVDTSRELLRALQELGVKELWLTPHVMEDFPNSPTRLKGIFDDFKEHKDVCHGIRLHLSSEHMLDSLFVHRLHNRDLLPIIDDRHILLETSYFNAPVGLWGVLNEIKNCGYIPVLAHPERFNYMGMSDYVTLKKEGIKFQLNYLSLLGAYGPFVSRKAVRLLVKEMYDMTGSDLHSLKGFMGCVHAPIKSKLIEKLNSLH